MEQQNVLVIGAGVAGMEASLILAEAGLNVHLVEKESLIGGQTIKFEEVYPNMECATCMIAPQQQDVLQNDRINVSLLSKVQSVEGSAGNFKVQVKKKARYVSLINCIGCGACYEPCPVSLGNAFEERMSQKKAIAVACPGALPNAPAIDPEACLRLNGKKKDCSACQEACGFDAIDFSQKDETVELNVGAIIVATGFDQFDVSTLPQYGYGKHPNVYTAMEFERLYAQNGPTEGELTLRQDKPIKSVGIIHCVGRKQEGYCSGVCCMYSMKFAYFIKDKVPDADIHEFHTDLCIPGKSHQKFYNELKDKGVHFCRFEDIKVSGQNGNLQVRSTNSDGKEKSTDTDMVILSPALTPPPDAEILAKSLGIPQDSTGFFSTQNQKLNPIDSEKEGIYVIGCAEGPKDISESVSQAEAAAGRVLSFLQ
ncbi:MAG: FAD-binding protein [Candidatus Aminicenantes bacterium]|nr:FAD-binding protein [Candidatus Aminicenantes bacterium]